MDSSPTPGALVVDSWEHFINLKKQNKFYAKASLANELQSVSSIKKYQNAFVIGKLKYLYQYTIYNI